MNIVIAVYSELFLNRMDRNLKQALFNIIYTDCFV